MVEDVKLDESLDDLIIGDLKVIQAQSGYRFSLDAVLLAHFCSLDKIEQVIDMGTGSGVIPLILTYRSAELQITGIEIQPQMADRARRSVKLNKLQNNITILEQDIKEINLFIEGACADLVLCNPPFYKKGQGRISLNPEEAIARHELEINMEEIIKQASYLLRDKGKMALIQKTERLTEVLDLFNIYKLKASRMRMVHTNIDSKAKLVLIEGQKNSRVNLEVLAPLIIYQAKGEYSDEIKKWYKGM